MATPGGRADPPLGRKLFEEPYRFDFFQAVRLLARLEPGRAPVGRDGPPGREVVRFRVHQSLSFPASEIRGLEPTGSPDGPPSMEVTFLGLTGPSGILPRFYTEQLLERGRAGDHASAAFLDLFNHRLLSLFYRAWEKYRFGVGFERGGKDQFTRCLFDLIGLGGPSLRGRHEFPDNALLFYAGMFAHRHRPAVALEALLGDYFKVPVEVHQFEGRWLRLEPEDRSSIGPSGGNNGLGTSLVLGSRVVDEQGMIRLRVGPLSLDEFLDFQPDGPSLRPLVQMARLFVDGEFDIRVQLVLKADQVPGSRLGGSPGAGPRLGRYAWLKVREFVHDVDGAVIDGFG